MHLQVPPYILLEGCSQHLSRLNTPQIIYFGHLILTVLTLREYGRDSAGEADQIILSM